MWLSMVLLMAISFATGSVITWSHLGTKGALEPDAIADAFWALHTQHPSAWTQELDLRPHKESW
jgi:heme/copper-type cytochrome/quinol oxidase subunit 3